MSMHPPVALTASRELRHYLDRYAEAAATDITYTTTLPRFRQLARHSDLVIIGTGLISRIRKPITCAPGGLIIVTDIDPDLDRAFRYAPTAGAHYVAVLPHAAPWMVDRLLQLPL